MRYSPSTGGFYPENIEYNVLPDDLIFISGNLYASLIKGQEEGGRIMPPDDGHQTPWLKKADLEKIQAQSRIGEIRYKINQLELSQARPLREIELANAGVGSESDKAFAVKKLTQIQSEIVSLRSELAELESESEVGHGRPDEEL